MPERTASVSQEQQLTKNFLYTYTLFISQKSFGGSYNKEYNKINRNSKFRKRKGKSEKANMKHNSRDDLESMSSIKFDYELPSSQGEKRRYYVIISIRTMIL